MLVKENKVIQKKKNSLHNIEERNYRRGVVHHFHH